MGRGNAVESSVVRHGTRCRQAGKASGTIGEKGKPGFLGRLTTRPISYRNVTAGIEFRAKTFLF